MEHLQLFLHPTIAALFPALVGSFHERAEERMRLQRLRLKFWMELAAYEVWMVGNLNDFNISSVRGCAADLQTSAGEDGLIFPVEFVTVAVALTDLCSAVDVGRQALRLQLASPGPQTHGAAQFVNAAQLTQLINYAMGRAGIELARISIFEPTHVTGKFDASRLHAQTNPKVGNLLFSSIADGI